MKVRISVDRLIVYIALSLWMGGTAMGMSNLLIDGDWFAVIPAALTLALGVTLGWMLAKDRKQMTRGQ